MTFDEQPDGDIHGECAAEINKLVAENNRLRKALQSIVNLDDGDEPAFWKFHKELNDAIEALK